MQSKAINQHKDTCGWQICASNEQVWWLLYKWSLLTSKHKTNANKTFNQHKDTCGWQICANNERVMSKSGDYCASGHCLLPSIKNKCKQSIICQYLPYVVKFLVSKCLYLLELWYEQFQNVNTFVTNQSWSSSIIFFFQRLPSLKQMQTKHLTNQHKDICGWQWPHSWSFLCGQIFYQKQSFRIWYF